MLLRKLSRKPSLPLLSTFPASTIWGKWIKSKPPTPSASHENGLHRFTSQLGFPNRYELIVPISAQGLRFMPELETAWRRRSQAKRVPKRTNRPTLSRRSELRGFAVMTATVGPSYDGFAFVFARWLHPSCSCMRCC